MFSGATNNMGGGGWGRGEQINSINILAIVIKEKEQHRRLNTGPSVREV